MTERMDTSVINPEKAAFVGVRVIMIKVGSPGRIFALDNGMVIL